MTRLELILIPDGHAILSLHYSDRFNVLCINRTVQTLQTILTNPDISSRLGRIEHNPNTVHYRILPPTYRTGFGETTPMAN